MSEITCKLLVQRSKLIRISAELVQGANLPSDLIDGYTQKTYSARRVAQMMESPHDRLRQIGVELSAIAGSLSEILGVDHGKD